MKGQKLTIDVSTKIFPISVLLHLLSLQELAVLQVVNKSADKEVRQAVKEGIIKPTLPPHAMSPEYQKSFMAFVQWRIKNFIATDSMCFEGMHQPSMARAVRKLFEMEALKSVTFKRSSLLVESLATTLKDTKLNDQTLFRSRNIQSLDFRECHTLTDSITTIFEVCPNLKTIKLSQCNQVSDDALLCLSTSCTQLESINLRYNTNITSNITRKKDVDSITGFCALLQNCRDLREIKYIGITNYDIHLPIAEYCKQLESITLYFPYLKDDGIVAPPVEKGTGTVEAPKDEDYDRVFTVVQIPAEFPGGLPAWAKYLERNLNRDLPVDNGAPPGKYTVIVSFIVDKNGGISEVQAENDPGYVTKDEAVRVIKKGPSWKPAVQNGRNVIYRHRQSITFMVSEE